MFDDMREQLFGSDTYDDEQETEMTLDQATDILDRSDSAYISSLVERQADQYEDPEQAQEDLTFDFKYDDGGYRFTGCLGSVNWNVELDEDAAQYAQSEDLL